MYEFLFTSQGQVLFVKINVVKKFFRKQVVNFLAKQAKKRLENYPVKVIGITGSVGKTTTKEALRLILQEKYKVHANQKSFNSEFGLPLTVLEQGSPKSIWQWPKVCAKAWQQAKKKPWFSHLVLEMGVDAPGDMDFLLTIIKPETGIFLSVAPVHMDDGQFDSVEKIAEEKSKLIRSLPTDGVSVLNRDDDLVWKYSTNAPQKISFGIKNESDVMAKNIKNTPNGIDFDLITKDETEKINLPILGKANVYSILAAIAVSKKYGIELEVIKEVLSKFKLPPGRLNLIQGINGSIIIDGSYNANLASNKSAINTLADMSGRRIAVLGQMNELGKSSRKYHEEIGKYVSGKIDLLITVFGNSKIIGENANMDSEKIKHFEKAEDAGEHLKGILQKGDTVLFKGSQNNVRLEKAVKIVMAYPEKASELLCRQGAGWN